METQMEFKSLTKMRRQRLESGKAEMTENLKLSSRRKELQGKKKSRNMLMVQLICSA